MDTDDFSKGPVLRPDPVSGLIAIRESCGLNHERQILTVACPADLSPDISIFSYRDAATGAVFPAQRSRQNSELAFVQLELKAGEEYHLALHREPADPIDYPVSLSTGDASLPFVSNGKWAAEVFLGEWKAEQTAPSYQTPVPINRVRVKNGPWRGHSFFDTRQPVHRISSTALEFGPLRLSILFQAHIGPSHSYTVRLNFDAGADYIAIEEIFRGDSGDQIVWDFSKQDLPDQIHLLDSTAGFASQNLHYFFDRRLARLACWNQYSQLHDFSDGYALTFPQNDDVVGFVALKGGEWRGNSHNFLEAWTRRWFPGDPTSRRLVPPEAKADAAPSPEKVSARPGNICEEHFSVEGWLHHGKRLFALVLCSRDSLRPADWNAAPALEHFETRPDRVRYQQQQSLLRRIHTQHGMIPLSDQLGWIQSWPREKAPAKVVQAEAPWIDADRPVSGQEHADSIPGRVEQMLEFLAARVFGFWEGSGSAYTNPVVSRRLAHDLMDWEWLVAHGHLTEEQIRQSRAWFVFLINLFSSDHFYPGPAAMNMGDPSLRLEPAMAGMANQNFFTDTFNMPGMAAQIFHEHPDAASWRERFGLMWRRQLEYHVYPESGVWEESHTYLHHVLQTIIPTLERQKDDGFDDGFAQPHFHRLIAGLLKTLTPRDICYDNKRHVLALGDHGVDLKNLYRPLYRTLSHYISASNPSLAAELAWAYSEMGGTESLEIKPIPASWKNEYVQGLGYFFRGQDSQGESLMMLRCGNAWAHHHNDDGSLQLISAGRSWIVDSAFSYPQRNGARKVHASGHSRWAPVDADPLNYLWQFNRGWISQHQGDGPFPHAVAFTPIYMAETKVQQYIPLRCPILHWRGVVQLAPSAFLLLDRSDIPISQVMRFHVPLDAPLALENDAPPALANTPYLRLHSIFGLHTAQTSTVDYPTTAGERFATREVLYAFKQEPLAALLIIVENTNQPSPLALRHSGNKTLISHPDFTAELLVHTPEEITLRHPTTSSEVTIPLRAV